MYISLNWLKDFVDIPKNVSKEQLGLLLTMHTLEIEGEQDNSEKFAKVVTGKVLEVKDHPKADKLKITKVDTGEKESLQIICGAPNVAEGQIVPVALVGAVLPNGLEIKEAKLRGELSQGMICAEDELGLGQDHEGIMVLEKKIKPGTSLTEALNLEDYVYEVDNKSLTNRPDLWGHYGLAREVSVFLNSKLKDYKKTLQEIKTDTENLEEIKIKVDEKEDCPRYMAAKINGIKVKESPEWLKKRLVNVGLRPINSIVDITNYVMLELGQPLHAFNAKTGNNIEVRKAKKTEVITTLDGKERNLNSDMLVIANEKEPIAIAGIMGGENSGITQDTESIILESANFEPINIRKASQALGLRTDASTRFEKALDPNFCELAIKKAINLISQIHPESKVVSEIEDVKNYEEKEIKIEISLNWLNKRIGQDLGREKILTILKNLGFKVEETSEDMLEVTVPSWRATKDISIKEDLLEEVSRIYGYDNLERKMPEVKLEFPEVNEEKKYKRNIRNILAKQEGFSEVYNYCFVGKNQLNKLNIDYSNYLELSEPLTENHTLLRQSLVPNLLNNIKLNQPRYEEIKLFEIGAVFYNSPGNFKKLGEKEGETLPYQEERLIISSASNSKEALRELKGNFESLISSLLFYTPEISYERGEESPVWSQDKYIAGVYIKQKEVGYIAKVSQEVANNLNLKKSVYVIEIFLKNLYNIIEIYKDLSYQGLEKYPGVERDLSFILDKSIDFQSIKSEINNFDELVKEVKLFDIYEGEKIGEDKKSLGFHIKFQASDKTLTNEEVEKKTTELINYLKEKFDLKIRDF